MAQTGLLHFVRNDRRRRSDDKNCFVIARRFRFWQRGTPLAPTKRSLVIARQFIAAAIHIIHVSTWRNLDCFTAFAMTGEGDDRNCFVIARLFRFWQRGTPLSPTKRSLVIARRSIAVAIHIIHVSTWRKVDCFTAFAMTGEEGGDDRNCFVIARLFRF